MYMRELCAALLIVCSGLFVGCASMPVSNGQVASIIITQLEATLDSVEAALVEIEGEDANSEAFRKAKVVIAIAKPQIIAWIDTIALLRGAGEEYNELKSRVDGVMPRVDAVLAD